MGLARVAEKFDQAQDLYDRALVEQRAKEPRESLASVKARFRGPRAGKKNG
jgi:hypothetical protein